MDKLTDLETELRQANTALLYENELLKAMLDNSCCDLMFEHGVVVDYSQKIVFIQYEDNVTSMAISFECKSEIHGAVLECIVEANNNG